MSMGTSTITSSPTFTASMVDSGSNGAGVGAAATAATPGTAPSSTDGAVPGSLGATGIGSTPIY
jgi:hypothetical protein